MEEFDRQTNVVGWFVLGSLAGAALALLTAPAKGSETRARLARGARQGADKVSAVGGRVAAGVRELRSGALRSGNGAAVDFDLAPEDVESAIPAGPGTAHVSEERAARTKATRV